jgi:hypothetical protein
MAQASSTFEVYKNIKIQKFICFLGLGPMGGVYLDFLLPCLAKIAVRLLTLQKWRSLENNLTVVWIALIFDHTYVSRLSQHQIE